MKAEITLRNGVQIVFDTEKIGTSRDRLNGNLTKLEWETPEDWERKLHFIDLGEIASIVMIYEESDKSAEGTDGITTEATTADGAVANQDAQQEGEAK